MVKMEDEITYEQLVFLYRKEKEKKPLVKLVPNFIEKVKSYLIEKKKIIEQSKNTDNVFSKDISAKAKKELKNAVRILREIFYQRQMKIINQALLSVRTETEVCDFEPMLEEERVLYEKISNLLRKNMDFFPNIEIKNLKENKGKLLKGNLIKVKVIDDVIPFIWDDGKVYGPFKKGEEVDLPKKIVEILQQDKKVIIK